MVNSMVQCNLILAAILKNGKTYVSEAEEEEFMFRCRQYSFHYMPGCRPPYPRRTFQRMWERRCAGAHRAAGTIGPRRRLARPALTSARAAPRRFDANWRTAFRMFSLGVPFFLIMLGVVSWVKFDSMVTAILISSIIGLGTLYWAMTHLRWSHYLMSSESTENTDNTTTDIDLHGFGLPFDWHARPSPAKPTSPGGSMGVYMDDPLRASADGRPTARAEFDSISGADGPDRFFDTINVEGLVDGVEAPEKGPQEGRGGAGNGALSP